MTIRILTLSLSLLFLSFGSFQVTAQLSDFANLSPPVNKSKSYLQKSYETASGQPVLIENVYYRYNDIGNILEKIVYNTLDSNAVDLKIHYQYEDDLLIEEIAENKFKITYLYDARGNRIAKKYKSDTEQYVERYQYDEKNQLLSKYLYNEEGILKFSDNYRYDNKHRLISREHQDADSAMNTFRTGYSRDIDGNVTQERVYAMNGHILYAKSFYYDTHNNKTEERKYSATGALQQRYRYKYIYDTNGNWTTLYYTFKSASYLITRSFVY